MSYIILAVLIYLLMGIGFAKAFKDFSEYANHNLSKREFYLVAIFFPFFLVWMALT